MKALLLKDFYALKEARVLIALMILISVAMALWGGIEQAGFVMGYLSILAAILVLNVISYDEADNGQAFLFTLPISRRQYVLEKYIFGWLTGFIGWGVAFLLSELTAVRAGESLAGELQWMPGGTLLGLLLMQAVMIPVQLKFGGQRGKLAMMLVIVLFCAGGAVLVNYVDLQWLEGLLGGMNRYGLLGAGAVVFLFGTAVSYLCSIRIMSRKEF